MVAIVAFEVVATDEIAPRVKHIALKPSATAEFPFIPGQFITIHFEKDHHPLKRSYSIASIPGTDQTIDFTASYVEHGPGSQYLFALKPGDKVQVSGPFGRLILKEEPVRRLFLLSTGTGVTPYRAMLPALSEKIRKDPAVKILIAQGVQRRQDVLYAQDFLAWAAQHRAQAEYRCYLSREDLSAHRESHEFSGYVQKSIEAFAIQPEGDIVYLCGNPNMIDQAFAQLQTLMLPTSQVRREKYISSK